LVDAIYGHSCPNCEGDVDASRLAIGSCCRNCVEKESGFKGLESLLTYLKSKGKLKFMKQDYEILKEYEVFSNYFQLLAGSVPKGPQRSWILRFLRGESFSVTAPPGLGKTTFGLAASIYSSVRGDRSILVFPTKSLVYQAKSKIEGIIDRLNVQLKYFSTVDGPQEEEYQILLTTSRYAMMHNELWSKGFRLIFVDDVDSVTKSRKSLDMLLGLAGFSQEELRTMRDMAREGEMETVREMRRKILSNKVVVLSSASVSRVTPALSLALGVRPSGSNIYTRNIIDSYTDFPADLVGWLRRTLTHLGPGGLVFVSVDKGVELAKSIYGELSEDLEAGLVNSSSSRAVEKFRNGELNYLIGIATHYGALVRGLDIPSRVKYAIFVGVPKFRFELGERMHPLAAMRLLITLAGVRRSPELNLLIGQMRRKLRSLSPAALAVVANAIREGKLDDNVFARVYEVVENAIKDHDTLQDMMNVGGFVLQDNFMLLPDHVTYLQASARTSRLLGGGLTTGLSIVLVDDWRLFSAFKNRLSYILDDLVWHPLNLEEQKVGETPLKQLIDRMEEERRIGVSKGNDLLKTVLFIVESPTKAKTISNLFSKPGVRELEGLRAYETMIGDKLVIVTYSGGHIYDLTTKERDLHGVYVKEDSPYAFIPYYETIVRCENGHSYVPSDVEGCPICGSTGLSMDKMDIVRSLRRLAMEVDEVFLGTDPDTEGEKIAWDVYLAVRPFNPRIKRAEFHEVTRKSITAAVNSPRALDLNLVASQVVRRIEDRWIGFELSGKLQRDFWPSFCKSREMNNCEGNRWLSAGRVQTPVLGWIIQRYTEYNKTKSRVYVVRLGNGWSVILGKGPEVRMRAKLKVNVGQVTETTDSFGPLPPYTTDSLLTDAFKILRLGARETMVIAQDLFEFGLITYHRTDSKRISDTGISIARNYLTELMGDEAKSAFVPRTWGEGGAHEAIRPTKPADRDQLKILFEEGVINPPRPLEYNHYRLYGLIFRRFLSSQLKPLMLVSHSAPITVHSKNNEVIWQGLLEGVVNVIYPNQRLEGKMYLPQLRLQAPLASGEYEGEVVRSFQRSQVELYTQGDVISEMRQKQVGRPSTYSTIMSKLLDKGYVMESKYSKRLIPSGLGVGVYEFLSSNYGEFVSEERTRTLLELMDKVEQGLDYRQVLMQLYSEIKNIRG